MSKQNEMVIKVLMDIRSVVANTTSMQRNINTSVEKISNKINNLTGSLAKFGLMMQGVQSMVNVFNQFAGGVIRFDTRMREVNTLLGLSEEKFRTVGNEIVELSKRVPKSAEDLASGLYQAVSAGIESGKAMGFLEVAARAATAGITDTKTSVDAITSVLNAYGAEAEEAGRISDIFFQTVKLGKTTFGELAPTLGQVIPVAATFGVAFEEVSAAFATLTKSGVPTTRAATSIGRAITEIVTPGAKAEKAIRELGFASGEAALKQETLQSVIQKLNEKGLNLTSLFGDEAARAVLLLGNNADEARADLDSMNNSAGSTNEAFAEMRRSFADSAAMLANTFNAKLIELGNIILPVVENGIKLVSTAVSNIDGTFIAVNATLAVLLLTWKRFGVRLGLFNTKISTAMRLSTMFKLSLRSLGNAFKSLYASMGPVGLAIAGLTIAFDLLMLFKKKDKSVTEDLTAATDKLTDAERRFVQQLRNIEDATSLDGLTNSLQTYKDQLTLLSKEEEGYKQIMRDLTQAVKEGTISQEELEKKVSDYNENHKQRNKHLKEEKKNLKELIDTTEFRIKTLEKAGLVSKEQVEAELKLKEVLAKKTAGLQDDIEALTARRQAILADGIAVDDLTIKERIRYEELQIQINQLIAAKDREAEKVEKAKQRIREAEEANERMRAQNSEERNLRRLALAGWTEKQILQVRIDSLNAELEAEETAAERKFEIQEELADRMLELDELNAKKKETFEGKLTAVLRKYSDKRLTFNLKERMETAKDTVMMGVNAAVAGVKGAAKLPFPINLIAVPAVLAVIFAALSKAKSVGASLLKMAEGGVVEKATVALIGEAGREIVAPPKKLERYLTQEITPMIQTQVQAKLTRGPDTLVNFDALESRLEKIEKTNVRIEKAILGQTFPVKEFAREVTRVKRGGL